MAAPHQNGSQNYIVSGVDGDNGRNGGNEFPQEPQPSTSGDEMEEDQRLPSLSDLCNRCLSLCREQLSRLTHHFSQHLGQWTPDAVYSALSYPERIIAWANDAASQSQLDKWYVMVPLKIYLMVTRTGLQLAGMYLDIRLPVNHHLVLWLRNLLTRVRAALQDASKRPGPDIELPELEPYCVRPVLSPSSSVSSMSIQELHSSEEEPAQQDSPGDNSLYFSVEQLQEQEEGTEVHVEDDKREKPEEKAQEGKVEEDRPRTAAEEGGAAMSIEQMQPEPQPQPQVPAPADCLVSAEEAERAAKGALPKPSAQPASSRDLSASEGSSRPKPYTRKPESRAISKPSKTTVLLGLFGTKMF